MDKTFHEVQAKVAKRLIHSDRHRRRKSIAPELITCNSKNHDLSRLRVKNEILFKKFEGQMSTLQNEHRRRQNELLRSERALAGSLRKRSLPQLPSTKSCSQKSHNRGKSQASGSRRNSLIDDELSSSSSNKIVQKWLQSFDIKTPGKNSLEVPSFCDLEDEPTKSACLEKDAKSGFAPDTSDANLKTNLEVKVGKSGVGTKNRSRPESESKVGGFEGENLNTIDDSKITGDSESDGLMRSTSIFIEADEVFLKKSLCSLTKI